MEKDSLTKTASKVSNAELNNWWPMLRKNIGFTGSDGSDLIAPLEKAWEFKAEGDIKAPPAVAYNLVIFGSKDKNVYAVDIETGEKKWTFKTNKAVTSTPIVADGMVYAISEDKHLYALNVKTGEKIWEFFTNDKEICGSPATGNSLVFFGCKDKHVYALDAKTGAKRWVFDSGDKDYNSPIVTEEKVLISSKGWVTKNLYVLNAKNGELIWKTEQVQADPCPIIYGDTVLAREAVDSKKRLLKINLETGEKQGYLLGFETRSAILSRGIIAAILKNPPNSFPDTEGLFVLKPAFEQYGLPLLARQGANLSGKDYSSTWIAKEKGNLSTPSVAGDFVFVTKIGGHELYGIHVSKYMKRWKSNIREKLVSYPVVSNGMLFVVSDKGKIHAFRSAKDPNAYNILEDFSGRSKRPIYPVEILYHFGFAWPKSCALCCGASHITMDTTSTSFSGKTIRTIRNVPYCQPCFNKVSRSSGGGKMLFGEKPGVELVSENKLLFRNEEYWAKFMELNGMR